MGDGKDPRGGETPGSPFGSIASRALGKRGGWAPEDDEPTETGPSASLAQSVPSPEDLLLTEIDPGVAPAALAASVSRPAPARPATAAPQPVRQTLGPAVGRAASAADVAPSAPASRRLASNPPGGAANPPKFQATMVFGSEPPTPRSSPEVAPSRPSEPAAPQSKGRPTIELEPGTRIGHYELIRELGRGGMGQVHLARDTKLGRRVAMKFLLGATAQFTGRFLVEARATAQCSHENIVIIHEVNEHGGIPYMVLESLEGQPLSAFVGDQPLPAARAVEIIVPVVRALVRAHEFNIVHRDLKPDNIFVTDAGAIKVLDFGIAKLFTGDDAGAGAGTGRPPDLEALEGISDSNLTREGALVGTLPYMSPEQFGAAPVDHRTDVWAVGIILYEMLAGRHPVQPLTAHTLMTSALMVDQPMPNVLEAAPHLSESLARVVNTCLAKRAEHRFATAQHLLDALLPLLPGRPGRKLDTDECPYPGLNAFQENDADRFFGRAQEIARAVARVREHPLVGLVGPSGVGKSSFVRAGLIPALKGSGETWESFVIRPGRHPMASLASILQPITKTAGRDPAATAEEHDAILRRLYREPGYLGTLLRNHARHRGTNALLFIDQFEELYTLVPDADERRAFTACLAGMADDAAAPLRVVLSMRSDFLDRVAEDQRFTEELTRGLVLLQAPSRAGLREALSQPVEMVGYRFESSEMVEHMLDALETTPGALPLLQFAAARMWDSRDRGRQLLTDERYRAMGGIAGTLASHADEVLASLAGAAQGITRLIFQRLVTPERTRAIVDVSELRELAGDEAEVENVVNHLVRARLLVVQKLSEAEGPAVEIVHESLIESWPTLRMWLDEGNEDRAFLAQLREAAKQWRGKGKPAGLLWRGDAMEEARLWHRRYKGELPAREREYLDAVFALANRASRIKRMAVGGTIAFLSVLVVAAVVALAWIRNAEQAAQQEADRARKAEATVSQQLQEIQDKERARLAATQDAESARGEVAMSKEELKEANAQLRQALVEAEGQEVHAKEAAERAAKEAERAKKAEREAIQAMEENKKLAAAEARARDKAEKLLAKESERVRALERERNKITTELKK